MEYAFSLTHQRMSIRFAISVILLFPALSCRLAGPTFDAIAEGYVRASLKLAQHDPSLVEDWRGPESWRPGPRVPAAQLMEDLTTLDRQLDIARSDISSPQEYARGQYLAAQLKALRFAAERQLGRSAGIDDQARDEFGVTLPPFDSTITARVHAVLNALLPGDRPLHERVAALRQGTIVPAARREEVLLAAHLACMHAINSVVPLLQDEGAHLVFRDNPGWDGFARYNGGRSSEIEISTGPMDVMRATRLVCHEGFGGHHTQHVLIDEISKKRSWPELQLTPGFGPHLLMTEGAAEVAADVILTRQQRETLLRDRVLPQAGLPPTLAPTLIDVDAALVELLPVVTDVARQYLDGTIAHERAIERLTEEALVSNPAGTLAFIEQRRARALVYGEGRRVVYGLIKTRDLSGLFAAFKTAAALQ
jgi:hypothetical protein